MTAPPAAFDVCVVGSANLDLVATSPTLPRPGETVLGSGYAEHAGGKGLNQAIAAARAGARTAFVGAVGDDDAGRFLLAELSAAGVDVTAVARSGEPTGRAMITVDGAGENSIVVVAGANAVVAVDELPLASVVLVQLEVPLSSAADALALGRSQGATTILNPAPAPGAPIDEQLDADIIVANEHETAALGGVAAIRAAGSSTVITTLGAGGAEVVEGDGAWHQRPFVVRPVDTTAAGDAFCGALSARLALADGLEAAVRFAAAAGALSTTRPGAVPSLPRAADVVDLLRQ